MTGETLIITYASVLRTLLGRKSSLSSVPTGAKTVGLWPANVDVLNAGDVVETWLALQAAMKIYMSGASGEARLEVLLREFLQDEVCASMYSNLFTRLDRSKGIPGGFSVQTASFGKFSDEQKETVKKSPPVAQGPYAAGLGQADIMADIFETAELIAANKKVIDKWKEAATKSLAVHAAESESETCLSKSASTRAMPPASMMSSSP
jgi:hypothetical protein